MTDPASDAGDDDLEAARYTAMRWNTPLSEAHADLLLSPLVLTKSGSILDLGCGWGELLIHAVARTGEAPVTGIGIDTNLPDLSRGRRAAAERGLAHRVRFVEASAVGWTDPADRVLCIGATHAWGGTEPALRALAETVKPGGRLLLLGEGFWLRDPSARVGDLRTRADVARRPRAARPHDRLAGASREPGRSTGMGRLRVDLETRSPWVAGSHGEHARAGALGEELQQSLLEYLDVYRGVLGYAYLVLSRSSQPA